MSETSKTKQQKHVVVAEIKEQIKAAKSFVVVNYKGLTVEQDTELRRSFREAGVKYRVLKNTLVRIALNELGYKEFDAALNGPSAFAFGITDALAPYKIAAEAAEKYKIEIKCGMWEEKYVDVTTVKALATIPSKPVLLSMFLSVLQAPIRGLAVSLGRIAEQKSEGANA